MDIKLKYKAWIGKRHADIAHTLMGNDIEIFALEFAQHINSFCFFREGNKKNYFF